MTGLHPVCHAAGYTGLPSDLMVASRENFPLLAELLAEQQRLATPAARFSETPAAAGSARPALEPVYRDLIPLSAPKPGEQYAFEVDLDACSGCKACVAACHALNGLDEHEAWRDVGLLVGPDDRRAFQQTVTTACHHCADPACLNGCPVLAYEKDPVTGIVRHLDDQCIGCQYCILKCPYDAPKYNARLGIVRKCDMCHGRLAHGEAPACVQACPTHAIRIVHVPAPPPRAPAPDFALGGKTPRAESETAPTDASRFLPGAPHANYTQPTTRYISRRELPAGTRAADSMALRPQPPHWPLVIMLTLLPLAVGCQLVAALEAPQASFTYYVKPAWGVAGEGGLREAGDLIAKLALVAGLAGLAASGFHPGRPLRAWRVFLGWRRSWLSREAIVFGAWLPLAFGAVAFPALIIPAALAGCIGLGCSVMVYADTQREFWRLPHSAIRILGSVVVLAAAVAIAFDIALGSFAWALAAGLLARLGCDACVLRRLNETDREAAAHGLVASARLLCGPLRIVWRTKVVATLLAGLLLPVWIITTAAPAGARWSVFALLLASEAAERWLFFRAVDAPKMPGQPG